MTEDDWADPSPDGTSPPDAEEEGIEESLEWRDYVALTAAMAQTVLLPFLIVVVVLALLLVVVLLFT